MKSGRKERVRAASSHRAPGGSPAAKTRVVSWPPTTVTVSWSGCSSSTATEAGTRSDSPAGRYSPGSFADVGQAVATTRSMVAKTVEASRWRSRAARSGTSGRGPAPGTRRG